MASPWRDVGRYGSVGIELVITIALCAFIGHWLDGKYRSGGDIGLGVGFAIGVAVGFRNLVRTAQGMQKDIERAEARDPRAGRWTVDESWLYRPDDSGPAEPKRDDAARGPRGPGAPGAGGSSG